MSSAHIEGESLIILFIITCLFLSLISKELTNRYGIPYTPLLIMFGLIIGLQTFLGRISDSVGLIMQIDPHAILTIFLPILIFESSFNARIPSLSTNFLQILLLIVPVVIISFNLIGVVIKVVNGYDELSWWEALTLGSILSATDPVAVVALLKELGAPIHINTIIEMESLFNDGTAMVFYTICIKFSTGNSMDIGESLALFLRLALGGTGLGIAFGIGALVALKLLSRGKTLFLHIIVLGSYSVFYVGESICQVSGLLAIVAYGLTLNKFMKDLMTQEQVHMAEEIISYIQFLNESLLFFFAGVIIGFELNSEFVGQLYAGDWGHLLVLYFFVILIRLVGIGIFYPILQKTGEGFDYKELILSVWGGLRGALGIALALAVFANKDFTSRRAKILILFHTCGIATLTLLINGTTAKGVVEDIDLILNLKARKAFKRLFLGHVKKQGYKCYSGLKMDPSYSMTLWKGVENIVQFNELDRLATERVSASLLISSTLGRIADQKARHRYSILRHMNKFLIDDHHEAYFYSTVFSLAEQAVQQCCEQPNQPIQLWERCERSFRIFRTLEKLRKQQSRPLGLVLDYFFYQQLAARFQLLDILSKLLSNTLELQKEYENKQISEKFILSELLDEQGLVNEEIAKLKATYSEELQRLSQQNAALNILKIQAQFLDSKVGNLIAEKEGSALRDTLFQKFEAVSSPLVPFKLLSGADLLISTVFGNLLNLEELNLLFQSKKVIQGKRGEELMARNEQIFLLILKGQVDEQVFSLENCSSTNLEYGPGAVLGLPRIIDSQIQLTVTSATEQVEAVKLNLFQFEGDRFRHFVYQRSFPEFCRLYCPYNNVQTMGCDQLQRFANDVEIRFNLDNLIPEQGAFVYEGEFSDPTVNNQRYGRRQFVGPQKVMIKSVSLESIIVVFKKSLIEAKTYRRGSHQVIQQSHKVHVQTDFEESRMMDESRMEDINQSIEAKIIIRP